MAAQSLRFGVQQIPDEGSEIEFSESMRSLCLPGDENQSYEKDLEAHFQSPITGKIRVFRVGSKVHAKGDFQTRYHGTCDRCLEEASNLIRGDWEAFLMPSAQFSRHDTVGGKFRGADLGEGEHEDVDFGEFDGETVDLRPYLREQVVLQTPMQFLCVPECKGLCVHCGQNLNREECAPSCPQERVSVGDEPPETPSPLAEALRKKSGKPV